MTEKAHIFSTFIVFHAPLRRSPANALETISTLCTVMCIVQPSILLNLVGYQFPFFCAHLLRNSKDMGGPGLCFDVSFGAIVGSG